MVELSLNDSQQRRLLRHMAAVREHWASVNWIKEGLRDNDLPKAAEAWLELPRDVQIALWVAPRFGGIWTTRERETMRTEEFRTAFE